MLINDVTELTVQRHVVIVYSLQMAKIFVFLGHDNVTCIRKVHTKFQTIQNFIKRKSAYNVSEQYTVSWQVKASG